MFAHIAEEEWWKDPEKILAIIDLIFLDYDPDKEVVS